MSNFPFCLTPSNNQRVIDRNPYKSVEFFFFKCVYSENMNTHLIYKYFKTFVYQKANKNKKVILYSKTGFKHKEFLKNFRLRFSMVNSIT